ncbi:MAG: hypothetical protein A2Y25_07670 [Candidatus Melainabacteria bacterium GWF2_37_15]|nr:MAG: hypothetical protein A2Y25_07670 [Candidatus Melainabacteria bacterium GWF2_37_15]
MNIREMFDSIADKYDFLNNLISLGLHKNIKKCAIKHVPLKQGAKVLDLCTGTGDIVILLSEKNVEITAVDFSPNMLEIAKKRAKNRKNISFMQADVLNLPFNDETFDAVFISFGLRNLTDLNKGILEMKRVVKTGGYVVNLDTGKPKGLFAPIFRFYFFKIVPLLGKAYKYLPESTQNFPSQEELVKIFLELGFKEVKNYNYAFGAIAQQVAKK